MGSDKERIHHLEHQLAEARAAGGLLLITTIAATVAAVVLSVVT